jgi:hypothetical protein
MLRLPSSAWGLWEAIEIVDASTNHHVDLASAKWSSIVYRERNSLGSCQTGATA